MSRQTSGKVVTMDFASNGLTAAIAGGGVYFGSSLKKKGETWQHTRI